ncbi:hypothetical protein PIB30_008295 [Stylosanthes scabra]|uniref:Serpin domain-containing protein n=1 Tax=Stylosanthes scabra TaxID=79078 RepID=A0ABU6S5E3_9FABA|nr:hypothetical protein [Stylosanthes scabra]
MHAAWGAGTSKPNSPTPPAKWPTRPATGEVACMQVEVAKEINSWAERETQGLINNIIDPLSIEMKNIIMANALYFKGLLWEPSDSFKKTKTVDGEFHLIDGGGSVKVPFMKRSPNVWAIAIAHQGFKVLTLRYMNAIQDVLKKQCVPNLNLLKEGTKAAATGRMMIHTMAGRGGKKKEPPMEFIADHPFLFMIREQITGTTLFIGQVLNPLHA